MGESKVDVEPGVRGCSGVAGFTYWAHFSRQDYSGGLVHHPFSDRVDLASIVDAAVAGGTTWTTAASAEFGSSPNLWAGWDTDEREKVRATFAEIRQV